MLGISFIQLIFILILALILIGPKQLPEVARQIGKLLNELRRASYMLGDEFRAQLRDDDFQRSIRPQNTAADPSETGPHKDHAGTSSEQTSDTSGEPKTEEKKS
jgi:sec-independent protein translocase protein TatB